MGDWRGGEMDVSTLLVSLYRSNTNLFTDVRFLCANGQILYGHKLILSLASQYFQDVFYGKNPAPPGPDNNGEVGDKTADNGRTDVINVTDVDKGLVGKFMDFVYTGEVETGNLAEVWELYGVAKMFDHQGLRKLCLDRAMAGCGVDSVIRNLDWGLQHQEEAVVEAAWAVVDQRTLELFSHPSWLSLGKKTMLALIGRDTLSATEGQLYQAVVDWAQERVNRGEFTSLREAMELFIPNIEFEHMGVREFLTSVVPSDTLTPDEFRTKCIQVIRHAYMARGKLKLLIFFI